MSAGPIPGAGDGPGASQDFDINIAPIIDAFVVLIAFMLASASFLAIGFFDAGISANTVAENQDKKPPPVSVEVKLHQDMSIQILVEGKKVKDQHQIKAAKDSWNLESLATRLESIQKQWPSVNALTLEAHDQIAYHDIVRVMEQARKTHPSVLLSGF